MATHCSADNTPGNKANPFTSTMGLFPRFREEINIFSIASFRPRFLLLPSCLNSGGVRRDQLSCVCADEERETQIERENERERERKRERDREIERSKPVKVHLHPKRCPTAPVAQSVRGILIFQINFF
jgi:hypothetical protein